MYNNHYNNDPMKCVGLVQNGPQHHKGNKKIYRTPSNLLKGNAKLISQQTDKISQQAENWENRNGPDLIQAFPKKWWVKSDFTVPNLPLPLQLKGSGCHYNSMSNNTRTLTIQ